MMKRTVLFCCVVFCVCHFSTLAQESIKANGRVTAAGDGTTLPGVSVKIKGSTSGVSTDENGAFILTVPKGATLQFTSIGFQQKDVQVNDEKALSVQLTGNDNSLDEVVVVGFGKQKKASVIGAISTVQTKEIKQSPSASLSVTLAGRLPGLTAIQRTGEPGRDAIELFIRGRSTLNEQRPLLMVDGVEREFNALDPNEIESISILKDATATAIYGVRGANGVILVTTRRGVANKPEINFSTEFGLTDFTRFPALVDSYNFAQLRNETLVNDGGQPQYSAQDIENYRLGTDPERYPNHNWFEEYTKKFAPQNRYNLNISGGTEKVRYFVSGGYLYQGGLFKTDQKDWDAETNLKRYNFRSNIDINLTKTLTATLNAAGYLEKQNSPAGLPGFTSPSSIIIVNALISAPANLLGSVTTPSGEVVFVPGGGGDHPVYALINRSGYSLEDRNNVLSTFALEQKLPFFIEGLSAKAQFSFDSRGVNTQRRERNFARYRPDFVTNPDGSETLNYTLYAGQNTPLGAQQINSFTSFSNIQASLNYINTFGKHNVSGLILFNQDRRIVNLEIPYNLRGLVGRATYNYANKYFTEFNFGYNGSEQFAKGKRYGFFPSISAGWLVSEEKFIKEKLPFINLLKLRASYGIAGNDRFGTQRFLYLDDYRNNGPTYADLGAGINELLIANPNVTWEESEKLNLGFESTFFNALSLTADVFFEKRNNVLARRGTIPDLFGSGAYPPLNIGIVQNRGFELELGYNKQLSQKVGIFSKANFVYAKNKVLFIDEPLLPANYAYRTRSTGFPIGQNFGLQTAGYFTSEAEINSWADQSRYGTTKPGDFKYIDQNGDGIVNDADQVPLGYPTVPLINFGLSLGFNYSNFDFSLLLQGTALAS